MPVAIVLLPGDVIPAVMYEDQPETLIAAVSALKDTPDIVGQAQLREFLQSLPEPSGWFDTVPEAKAHVARYRQAVKPPRGGEIRQFREDVLNMGRAEFATALGFGGNDNTRHKLIYDIEVEKADRKSGKKRVLNPEATRAFRALAAQHKIGKLDS